MLQTKIRQREDGREFKVWEMATVQAASGPAFKVTSVTGVNNGPRAAAFNLNNSNHGWLTGVVRRRMVLGRSGQFVTVELPDVSIEVPGEEPFKATFRAQVASTKDVGLGASLIADQLARTIANKVYAMFPKAESAAEPTADEAEMPEF